MMNLPRPSKYLRQETAIDRKPHSQGWELPILPDDARLIPRPQPWTPVAAVACIAIFAFLLWRFLENPVVDRAVILEYLFKDVTLRGVGVTLYLTAISMVAGIAGAIILAMMHLSDNIVLSTLARLYISIFRGTPLLVQLIFWGYLGIFTPDISLSLPGIGTIFSFPTSDVVTPMVAAILALSLNAAAYSAEIVRSGILSVPRGQVEAARSVGMTRLQAFRRVVMPQALRVIIPPMGNEVIAMLKGTSLVSVIAGNDLMTNLQNVYSQTFQIIPLLIVASIWYLILVSLLTIPQTWLERRFGQSVARTRSPRQQSRLRGLWNMRLRSVTAGGERS
ncbi:amino acid ABC transporter permease [Aminobacter sp. UC22_36]|uniref:amino acid ABC transporter permease n=1 Tax=Aminobacter sp. UC22_36 TaxID=3374549 RepID=UPI0037565B61